MTRTSRQSFLTGQNAEAASVLANLRSANDKFQHIKRADSQTAENEFFEVRAGVRSKHADVSTRQHMLFAIKIVTAHQQWHLRAPGTTSLRWHD